MEFAEVKDDLTVHYYTHKADKEGEEKKEKFEKALERLSREKAKDEIAKIEKKQADELNKLVEKWRDKLQKEIQKCEADMAQMEEGDWVYNELKKERDAAKKKLEGENKFRKETKKELDDGTKDEIKELEKKHYKEVLAAAAKGLFELVKVGPYTKKLQEMPRFTESHSKLVRFLFKKSELMEMKEGEATDLLEDTTERRICLAVCTRVRKAESSSISRRQWKAKQDGMTMFALRQRFIANPQELLVSLFRAFQQDPSLRPLQPLFYQAMGGNKEKARELVNHPTFLPLLQRMISGSIPFASAQKQLAANQSFTLDALKRGYGWRDPSAGKPPGADAKNPDADQGKADSEPTSEKTGPGK